MADWNKRFMDLALHISGWSKDRKRKVGAVIVDEDRRIISCGYNGPPHNVDDEDESRHVKPKKLLYFEHAESNSIINCSRSGVSTKGATMYITSYSCASCCRAIIQSGIKRVICNEPDFDSGSWAESFRAAREMFEEAGIEVIYHKD